MDNILNYEPQAVWKFFSEISDVPRESGNEEGIRKYLVNQAKKYGFKYDTDEIGNVYYYKEGTKGYENRPKVALQGHMDMVCVKTPNSNHNFEKDPLSLYVDGDWLRATDTTLGADNGIAVAMILAIFSSNNIPHGPLEAIITVSEETGLTGALNVVPEKVSSKMMMNLDSEDEGIIYIGCAGGVEVNAKKKLNYENLDNSLQSYKISISGLKGGHSGAEIDKKRANAVKMAFDILFDLQEKTPVKLIGVDGGTRKNVIPSNCQVEFALSKDFNIEKIVEKRKKIFKDIYEVSDTNFKILITKIDSKKSLNQKDSYQIINAIFSTPFGVEAMSSSFENIVETSSNFAIARINEKDGLVLISSCRSSIEGSRDDIAKRIGTVWSNIENAKINYDGHYPSWKPDLSLNLYKFCSKAYKEYTNIEPVVTAIHAGLECGIINSRIKNLDSVSFGPNIRGAHSVEERLSIKSTQNIFGFLLHLLTIIE